MPGCTGGGCIGGGCMPGCVGAAGGGVWPDGTARGAPGAIDGGGAVGAWAPAGAASSQVAANVTASVFGRNRMKTNPISQARRKDTLSPGHACRLAGSVLSGGAPMQPRTPRGRGT